MEAALGNNSFINNNYGTKTVQNTHSTYRFPDGQNNYSKKRLSAPPLNDYNEQLFETYRNLDILIDALENKIYGFQSIEGPGGILDEYLDDLKNLVCSLRLLKENLSSGNLDQTLMDLKSLGNDNYELLEQLLKTQNISSNKKSAPIRSYMFSFYDKVNEKKPQSLGIDIYY